MYEKPRGAFETLTQRMADACLATMPGFGPAPEAPADEAAQRQLYEMCIRDSHHAPDPFQAVQEPVPGRAPPIHDVGGFELLLPRRAFRPCLGSPEVRHKIPVIAIANQDAEGNAVPPELYDHRPARVDGSGNRPMHIAGRCNGCLLYTSHMIHGGDYNPDQWMKDKDKIWKEDMRLAREAHMNSLTVGIFSWTALEPEEGVYTFEWLDEVMDMLAQNHMAAILATPSGAKPRWMAQKYPEILRVSEDLSLIHI